jgi:hypothetical protein
MAGVLGLDRLQLFVPALMTVGLVVWILGEANEIARSRAKATRVRRARIAAASIVDETLGRPPSGTLGLRPRPVYVMIAATSIAAALYVLIGSIGNFTRSGGYVEGEAWLLALAAVASLLGVGFGVTALVVAVTWPQPPPWARGVLLRSPLGSTSLPEDRSARPHWTTTAFVVWSAAVMAATTAFVAWSPENAERFNERVAGWVDSLGVLDSVAFLVPAGEDWIALGLAAVTVLLAYRCRVVVVNYVASILVGALVVVALRPLVAQAHQARASAFGSVDTYPSLPMFLVVVFAGLAPLALAVLFERTWIILPLRVGLGTLAVAAGLHRIDDGTLATDIVGGALLGLVAVGATQWLVSRETSHTHCNGCPWSAAPYHGPILGAIPIHPDAHDALSFAARVTAFAATIGLGLMALRIELPADTSDYGLGVPVQQNVQYALTALMSVGALLAWRWEGVGALLIAVAAAGAGIFAALQYVPGVALALTLALMVPAVLLWLSWQHRRSPREIVGLAVLATVLIGGSWAGANTVHEHFFGPTHEESVAPDIPVDRVEWVWSGALSPTGVTVTARIVEGATSARLEVDPGGGPVVASESVTPDEYRMVSLRVDGLRPGAEHRYRVVVDGEPDRGRGFGEFSTPVDGALSFTVTASACARTGSNVAVFDTIRAIDPLFHLALGDLHYGNIDSTDPEEFVDAYGVALSTPAQSALARQAPVAYVWDDHDYGPNDADASFVGRAASREAYRVSVPHYPVTDGDTPINQAFTIGRVRFVMTDQRSERTADTMLGAAQKAWLLDELRTASRTHAVVVWVNSVPWIGPAKPGSDNWTGQPAERTEIAEAIAVEGIDNLVMLSGDAHMLAVDDGSNSDYSTTGGAGFPVFHTAALDRPGNVKGGPYSEGAFPGFGQFGVLEFVDDGGPAVTVRLSGRNWLDETLVAYERTFATPVS